MQNTARATPRINGNCLLAVGHAPCDIADPNQWIASYKYLPE